MANNHLRRSNLFSYQRGLCAFCERLMDLSTSSQQPNKPDDAACLYHLDTRLDADRGLYPRGQYRTVLLCHVCEREAQRARTAALPTDTLHALSGYGKLRRRKNQIEDPRP